MDSGSLAWIIPLAALVGGAIGWFSQQYWRYRVAKREATTDATQILKDQIDDLEKNISKTDDNSQKKELRAQLDRKKDQLRGLYTINLRRSLKDAGLPSEDLLAAAGRTPLKPQQVDELKKEIAAVESLPLSDLIPELLTLAQAYYYSDLYEDAERIYDRILNLSPDDPLTLNNRGSAYEKLGKYDEALADFNRSLELRPDYPLTLYNRGTTYAKLKKYDEAIVDFSRALELRPGHSYTLYNIACAFSLCEKPDEALDYLKKAVTQEKQFREDAKTDEDFDNIRKDPRFKKLVGEK